MRALSHLRRSRKNRPEPAVRADAAALRANALPALRSGRCIDAELAHSSQQSLFNELKTFPDGSGLSLQRVIGRRLVLAHYDASQIEPGELSVHAQDQDGSILFGELCPKLRNARLGFGAEIRERFGPHFLGD